MTTQDKKRIGRKLSLVLRHKPEAISIQLDANGWADVQQLLEKMNASKTPLTKVELIDIVLNNDKQRYRFNENRTKIRANQGHSLEGVDLELLPKQPPAMLYHGTATRFLGSILDQGLIKGSRHHVHLSDEVETASKVGQRHGKLAILLVNSAKMYADGYTFFQSDNGVWLTDAVPTGYLREA